MDSLTTHREDLNSSLLLSLCPVSYFCSAAVTCKLHTSLKGFPKTQDMTSPVWQAKVLSLPDVQAMLARLQH